MLVSIRIAHSIVGGTTALWEYLTASGMVKPSRRVANEPAYFEKEINFFNNNTR